MKPKYQIRKKAVAGPTNALFLRISSRNSGDRSAATQSISGWWVEPVAVPGDSLVAITGLPSS
jgi:hypothetical protein